MIYIKLTNNQIQTLKNLPNNLNDNLCSNSINGLMILTKSNEFKQIIMDFQSSSLEEFFTKKNGSKISLLKHIRNENPRNNYVLTFEIANILSNSKSKISNYSIPGINQWIKCSLHAVYRKIFNHILLTPSDKIYCISIKKTYYYHLLEYKQKKNVKMNELLHYLLKSYSDIYHKYNGSELQIPEIFHKYFNIQTFTNNNGIMLEYMSYNVDLSEAKVMF